MSLFDYLQNKKILITGHTGFKGSWLCKILNRYNTNIYGYSLFPVQQESLYEILQIQKILNSECINDINNISTLRDFINDVKPDIIFHLAAQPLVRRSYKEPKYTFETNAVGTLNILECLRDYGKKCQVVCITTDKVYENNESGIPFTESDKLGGYDPYSASKAAAEIIIDSYRKSFFNPKDYGIKHEIQLASVRAGNVIGGGDFAEDRIIPDIIRAIQSNSDIKIRNPFAIRPWQHVIEPLFGYIGLACRMCNNFNNDFCSSFNFGPDDSSFKTVKYIADSAVKNFSYRSWVDESNGQNPHEAKVLKLNINKAKRVLDWNPQFNIDKTLKFTFDWYKAYLNNNDVIGLTERQINEYEQLAKK